MASPAFLSKRPAMPLIDREQIAARLAALPQVEAALADPAVAADRARCKTELRKLTALRRLAAASEEYFRLQDDAETARAMAADPEMTELAQEELDRVAAETPEAEKRLLHALLPEDPLDARDAMVEIRAGTGGEEAALFAGDLYRMYARWAEAHGFSITVMDQSPSELGGFKEIVLSVSGGERPYGRLRFESGGHRVQRVPVTESQGRIHTSAATVIVLPAADAEDGLEIPESELRIDIFCAGGHGGQGVNTTYSAVRITERSQHRNKEKALAVLKARILDTRRQAAEAAAGATRLTLRGSGDRSQRIRTYNFPQNRLTDHRIGLTLYALDRVMEGDLDPVLEPLEAADLEQRIHAALGD